LMQARPGAPGQHRAAVPRGELPLGPDARPGTVRARPVETEAQGDASREEHLAVESMPAPLGPDGYRGQHAGAAALAGDATVAPGQSRRDETVLRTRVVLHPYKPRALRAAHHTGEHVRDVHAEPVTAVVRSGEEGVGENQHTVMGSEDG